MATLKQAKRALDLFEDALSGRPNVVGLGIVPNPRETETGGMAVCVYVKKKLPKHRLAPEDLVPETLSLPGKGQTIEVPTCVIEQGEVQLEGREPLP